MIDLFIYNLCISKCQQGGIDCQIINGTKDGISQPSFDWDHLYWLEYIVRQINSNINFKV